MIARFKEEFIEGAKANKLTIALRAKGYEAYQFHERKFSIVTVGSFLRPGVPRPGGTIEYEPQVVDMIRRFGAKRKTVRPLGPKHPGMQTNLQPEALLGIPFDAVPALIKVPKRSISADYVRRPVR